VGAGGVDAASRREDFVGELEAWLEVATCNSALQSLNNNNHSLNLDLSLNPKHNLSPS